MNTLLRPRRVIALIAAAAALQGCSPPERAGESDAGQYGASSGANPNLSDVQNGTAQGNLSDPAMAGAATNPNTQSGTQGQAYPSQETQAAPDTGAAGGRGSANTGATGGGNTGTP